MHQNLIRTVAFAVAVAVCATPASAQVIAGNARAAGMADAFGAVARGTDAALYNPANLGLPGNPSFGLQLPAASIDYGSSPITFSDFERYGGEVVPDDVKRDWLDRIPADGALSLGAGADVSALAVSTGPLAFTFGAVAHTDVAMPRDAVELFLFGNAGADGEPQDLTLADGTASGFAASFAAVSYGRTVMRRGAAAAASLLSVGVTAKYVQGHGYFAMQEAGGTVGADPIEADLRFPAVTVWSEDSWRTSTGVGLDVGVAYHTPVLDAGLTISDLVNTFEWSLDDARIRDGRAFVSEDSSSGGFDERMLDDEALDPEVVEQARGLVADAVFKPVLRAAVGYRPTERLLVTADLVRRTGGERRLQSGPATSMGLGAELQTIARGVLPLRVGGALMTGGTAWSAGTGLALGGFGIDVAYGRRNGDGIDAERVSFGLSFNH